MKVNSIIIKSEDYKYPSNEERKTIETSYPNIANFGFEYKDDIDLFFNKKKSLCETNKYLNLFWWDNCLHNKLSKLRNAYVNTIVNYNRDLIENQNDLTGVKCIHRLQFDFYAETFYYFLFSARDITFQVLNNYFNLNLEDRKVNIHSIKQNLDNDFVTKIIAELERNFESASEIRNSFTHRFPKNKEDYRVTYSKDKESERLSAGSGDVLKPKEISGNINQSLLFFSNFINGLKEYINTKLND